MSRCNLIEVEDIGRLCAVHGRPAPCPSNGKPALPYPIHAFTDPDRVAAIDEARFVTAGSRPILLHNGSATDETPGHNTGLGVTDCWCQPVTILSG